MMTKMMRKAGLLLFVLGFGAFLSSVFFESYQLTETIIDQKVSDAEKAGMLKTFGEEMLSRPYQDPFSFNRELNDLFDQLNKYQQGRYGLSPSLLDEIVIACPNFLIDFEKIKQVFNSEDPLTQYQWSQFQTYASWLDGRKASSEDELRNWLITVQYNISQYAIIPQKGLDQYQIKELKFQLTKLSSFGLISSFSGLSLFLVYCLTIFGALVFIYSDKIMRPESGIKNDGIFHDNVSSRGWLGMLLGGFLIGFYVFLYFFPEYMTTWIIMVDPISFWLKGSEAGRFFLYGFIYTIAILVMGVRMIIKYRHSKYQMLRTASVMFFQLCFAFLIPEILIRLNQPYFDFKNIWPLDYDFFFDNELNTLLNHGGIGIFMLGWGIGLFLIGVPLMVYFFGKRWYCSWVCGCGGLAETLGDSFRQLSDKSLKAWQVERWSIYGVLVFAVLMTVGVLYTYWTGNSELMGVSSYQIRSVYGSWIGAGFAGVVGTGFYPLMGNRVWCRFGCPLAAYLGLVQRFKSRFRITTNGGQCISCGNCSTYCEMGIDVRWYAQRGQNIVRSSCVGCGVCSSVCPRGVLNLENIAGDNRFESAGLIGTNRNLESEEK